MCPNTFILYKYLLVIENAVFAHPAKELKKRYLHLSISFVCILPSLITSYTFSGRPRVEVHLGDKKRLLHSPYFNLMREVRIANQVQYFNYLRMTPSIFEELCGMVGPFIQRQDTNMRKAITVGNDTSENIIMFTVTLCNCALQVNDWLSRFECWLLGRASIHSLSNSELVFPPARK